LIRAGRIRESGMPPEEVWSRYFNVPKILDGIGINSGLKDVADFACGYGTFTIPAAQRIRGIVFALDVDPQMVSIVQEKSTRLGLVNVRPILRDLLHDGSGLEDGSVDYVILFNILHSEDPVIMLQECARVLKQRRRPQKKASKLSCLKKIPKLAFRSTAWVSCPEPRVAFWRTFLR
jgi:SAM-dependent methyltransferase